MSAKDINEFFQGLPSEMHLIAFALLIVLYAHLFLGFWMVRKRLKNHVIKYFIARSSFVFTLILFKSIYTNMGMFDIFYPIYIITYIDGLILLNGFSFYRCSNMKGAFLKLIKFNTVK